MMVSFLGPLSRALTAQRSTGLGALTAVFKTGVELMALKPFSSNEAKTGALKEGVDSVCGLGPGVGGEVPRRTGGERFEAKNAPSSSAAEN